MPETRPKLKQFIFAVANLAAAVCLAVIAWKAAVWGHAVNSSLNIYEHSDGPAIIAIYLVSGFAALLAIAAIGNAAYLTFRRQD